jgi:DNA-binding SARP family transcriptional activator
VPFLDLRCLGNLTVFRDRQRIGPSRSGRRRAWTLLKILLTSYGKPVGREVLVDLLWPGDQPPAAAAQLKVLVHDLRRSLQPRPAPESPDRFITWTGEGYAFDTASPHRLDSRDFTLLTQWGRRLEGLGDTESSLVAFQSAAGLYGGDFLEEERYSDWCAAERDYLRETFLSALRRVAAMLEQRGDVEGAIAAYRRALRTDAVLEDVHRALMRLLWEGGRRDDALRQYRALREVQGALDLAPGPETEGLRARIEAAAGPPAGPPAAPPHL